MVGTANEQPYRAWEDTGGDITSPSSASEGFSIMVRRCSCEVHTSSACTGLWQEQQCGRGEQVGNSTWSHAVGALNPQLYPRGFLSAGLIFIAAGVSFATFRLALSLVLPFRLHYPFLCLSSHLTLVLDHHLYHLPNDAILPPFSPPCLAFYVRMAYVGSFNKDPTNSLCSPPCSPPPLSLGYCCRQIYIHLALRSLLNHDPCTLRSTSPKRVRPFTNFIEA